MRPIAAIELVGLREAADDPFQTFAIADPKVCYGSLAAPQNSTTSRSAIGRIPAVPQRFFRNQKLNVCFGRKRSFEFNEKHQFDRPLTAVTSTGRCNTLS